MINIGNINDDNNLHLLGNYRVDSRSNRQDSYNIGGSLMKSGSPNLPGRGSYSRSSDRGRDENGPQHNNDRRQIPEKVVVKNVRFSFSLSLRLNVNLGNLL